MRMRYSPPSLSASLVAQSKLPRRGVISFITSYHMLSVQSWRSPKPFKCAKTSAKAGWQTRQIRGRESPHHRCNTQAQGVLYAYSPVCSSEASTCKRILDTGDSSDKESPEFNIQDPSQIVAWGGRLPSRRRAVTGFASGALIGTALCSAFPQSTRRGNNGHYKFITAVEVLVSNLGGITGTLLGVDDGALAARLHLDVLYPVRGLKRCLDARNGFEFQYPSTWLADQRMFRRNAERQESLQGLDLPSVRPRRNVAEPVAAFGPPGSSGELNISTIVAPIQQGFTLSSLGGAREAGERFLSTTIAPEGSQLQATLLTASERKDEAGQLYYSLEYKVTRPGNFSRHNISTYAARNGVLYTLNAQCPESSWDKNQEILQKAAASFRVIKAGPPPPELRPPPRAS